MSEPITLKRHLRMNTPDKADFFDQTAQGVLSQPLDRPEGKLKVTGDSLRDAPKHAARLDASQG